MDNKDDISISMLIDNGIKRTIYQDNELFTPLPLKNSINLDERRIHSWIKDDSVKTCYECLDIFTLTNRKHHCRNCGKIFCSKCSGYYIKIPEKIKTVEKQINYLDYRTYKEYLNLNEDKERVCKKCHDNIFELKELDKIIKFFDLLPLDMKDYKNIACVCKSWNKISKYYFSSMRELQYKFTDHKYSKKEIKVLETNSKYFAGHSKWILQLILVTDWEDPKVKNKQAVLKLISDKKNTSCWNLMCTRSCCSTLQVEDIIIILSQKYTYYPLVKKIINIWISRINNPNISDEIINFEFSCFMHLIVNKLHFYKNYSNICSLLENFLLDVSNRKTNLQNQLFWLLTQNITNPQSSIYFKSLRTKLVKQLDKETYKLFQNGYDFTQNLIKMGSHSEEAAENIKKYLYEYRESIQAFYLPIDTNLKFDKIDYNNIKIIDSKTKPIILPCIYNKTEVHNIMLKKEDIRKEEIIMKIIKLMDYFLKKEEDLDLHVTTYNILPISHQYGYIEFVPDSATLYKIKEDDNFSIQNWLIENNPNSNISEIRERISKSCALYCIITYLLGIGDRHLDNIMITKDGKLFHIDFGYILGIDPKPLSPEIRLTAEMIDAMGGVNSKYYAEFKDYCGKAYNCLRRHSSLFYILLLDLLDFSPPLDGHIISKEKIKYHIVNRFIPGETYSNAIKQIKYKIELNSNTYSETVIDYFHKKCKSSNSSSLQDSTIDHAVETAIDYSKFVKNSVVKGLKSLWKKF